MGIIQQSDVRSYADVLQDVDQAMESRSVRSSSLALRRRIPKEPETNKIYTDGVQQPKLPALTPKLRMGVMNVDVAYLIMGQLENWDDKKSFCLVAQQWHDAGVKWLFRRAVAFPRYTMCEWHRNPKEFGRPRILAPLSNVVLHKFRAAEEMRVYQFCVDPARDTEVMKTLLLHMDRLFLITWWAVNSPTEEIVTFLAHHRPDVNVTLLVAPNMAGPKDLCRHSDCSRIQPSTRMWEYETSFQELRLASICDFSNLQTLKINLSHEFGRCGHLFRRAAEFRKMVVSCPGLQVLHIKISEGIEYKDKHGTANYLLSEDVATDVLFPAIKELKIVGNDPFRGYFMHHVHPPPLRPNAHPWNFSRMEKLHITGHLDEFLGIIASSIGNCGHLKNLKVCNLHNERHADGLVTLLKHVAGLEELEIDVRNTCEKRLVGYNSVLNKDFAARNPKLRWCYLNTFALWKTTDSGSFETEMLASRFPKIEWMRIAISWDSPYRGWVKRMWTIVGFYTPFDAPVDVDTFILYRLEETGPNSCFYRHEHLHPTWLCRGMGHRE